MNKRISIGSSSIIVGLIGLGLIGLTAFSDPSDLDSYTQIALFQAAQFLGPLLIAVAALGMILRDLASDDG